MVLFVLKYAKPLFFAATVLAFLGAFASVYYLGKQVERQVLLQDSLKVLRKKAETDARIKNLNDHDLCIAIGGVPNDDGRCM